MTMTSSKGPTDGDGMEPTIQVGKQVQKMDEMERSQPFRPDPSIPYDFILQE